MNTIYNAVIKWKTLFVVRVLDAFAGMHLKNPIINASKVRIISINYEHLNINYNIVYE